MKACGKRKTRRINVVRVFDGWRRRRCPSCQAVARDLGDLIGLCTDFCTPALKKDAPSYHEGAIPSPHFSCYPRPITKVHRVALGRVDVMASPYARHLLARQVERGLDDCTAWCRGLGARSAVCGTDRFDQVEGITHLSDRRIDCTRPALRQSLRISSAQRAKNITPASPAMYPKTA